MKEETIGFHFWLGGGLSGEVFFAGGMRLELEDFARYACCEGKTESGWRQWRKG